MLFGRFPISSRSLLLGLLGCVVMFAVWTYKTYEMSAQGGHGGTTTSKPVSRLWVEYAEQVVKEQKPAPPASARIYAYVASAYALTLESTKSSEEASTAVADILDVLVPSYEASTTQMRMQLWGKDGRTQLSRSAQKIVDELATRVKKDGSSEIWKGQPPQGKEYWVGEKPAAPRAGSWKRWIVQVGEVAVPPPPKWGSEEFKKGLAETKRAASERTPEQAAAVNFWGGVPGTVAPAGIWQDRLYNETIEYHLSDEEYAWAQMVLAQTVADAFMECWKVKYMYWTSRPSMNDPSIDLAMANPPFPSYVSGHSTISRAASEALSALFPKKRERWLSDAAEARDSRLWAGIHFPYDNEQGFSLGEKVGEIAVERLRVSAMR